MLSSVRKYQLPVISVRPLTESTFVLRVERGTFTFRAGQFVNLGLPDGDTTREYSIYSGTSDPYLDFLIREIPEGALSPQLRRARPGDEVVIDGPYDEMFSIKKTNSGRKHLLVATGTGISPFHSFVASHPDLDYQLIHGVRLASEQYDCADYSGARYVGCLSREDGAFRGRVTEYLLMHPPAPDAVVYLCGSSQMIYSVNDWLIDRGFPSQSIFSETFF